MINSDFLTIIIVNQFNSRRKKHFLLNILMLTNITEMQDETYDRSNM